MTLTKALLFPLLIMLLGLTDGCPRQDELSEAERRKLDPTLQHMLAEEEGRISPDRYDVTERPDGTLEFGVVITAEDPEVLRGRFNIQSVFGQMATARLSRQELRELLRLEEVKYVQMGERSYPETYDPDG